MFSRFTCARTLDNRIEIIKKWCRLHSSFIVPSRLKMIHSLYFSFNLIWKRGFSVNPAYNLIIGMKRFVNRSDMNEDLGWSNGFKWKQKLFKRFSFADNAENVHIFGIGQFLFSFCVEVTKLFDVYMDRCFTVMIEFNGNFKVVLLILSTFWTNVFFLIASKIW